MKTIKTIADFKRAMEVGTKLHTVYHQAFAGRDEKQMTIYQDEDRGVREVSNIQSNSFALATTYKDKPGTFDSWCSWPKASHVRIENNKVTILEEDLREGKSKELVPILTYSIID